MKCSKCNGKGFIPEYINGFNDGRCWRCAGTGELINNPKTQQKTKKIKKERPEILRLRRQLRENKELLIKFDGKDILSVDLLNGIKEARKEILKQLEMEGVTHEVI